jgi:ABC-type multidrug transport system fused ATPase/permease subunit
MLPLSRNPAGKLVTRLNHDVQNMAELFRNMLIGLFKDFLLFLDIAAVMFALNAGLAFVCMLIVPLMALITYFFARFSREIFRRLKGYTGKLNTLPKGQILAVVGPSGSGKNTLVNLLLRLKEMRAYK